MMKEVLYIEFLTGGRWDQALCLSADKVPDFYQRTHRPCNEISGKPIAPEHHLSARRNLTSLYAHDTLSRLVRVVLGTDAQSHQVSVSQDLYVTPP